VLDLTKISAGQEAEIAKVRKSSNHKLLTVASPHRC